MPTVVQARRGCCSHHGGVAGCSSSGRQICRDGTLSPSCTCSSPTNKPTTKKSVVYGCTDKNAFNYNSKATKDNGSCIAKKYGCMDKTAINYDKKANTSNSSCQYEKKEKEMESISYDTEYKNVKNKGNSEERVVQKGRNGKKEITYKTIVDEKGSVLSKEIINEEIIDYPLKEIIETNTIPLESSSTNIEPSNGNQQTESNSFFLGIWLISIVLSWVYANTHKNENLIWNKIAKQRKYKIILYSLYALLIVPVFFDIFIIIKNVWKNFILKKKYKSL